ncbi:hypothetical protein BJX76DRAFT_233097 [Aspergillus varians]
MKVTQTSPLSEPCQTYLQTLVNQPCSSEKLLDSGRICFFRHERKSWLAAVMNVPSMSTEPGQAQPQEADSGRARTVTSACERCRRRKIRCDGETPCSTCRRFHITCVRIQKNDTHALEQRVRQLEAQIAEFAALSNTQSHTLDAPSTPQQWRPDICLNPDFGSLGPAVTMNQTLSQHHPASSLTPLQIPSIQVIDYADSLSPVSPVSPVSLSPSPLLHALAPAPPHQTQDNLHSGLRPLGTGAAFSPPTTVCPSPTHFTMPYLSPRSVAGTSRSRSSSISSLASFDTDWGSAPGNPSMYGLRDTELDSSLFDMSSFSPGVEVAWTPTRFEFQTLLDKFFDRTPPARYPLAQYCLDRTKLFEFLDIIDPPPGGPPAGHEITCSVSMARFHVYMVMAIGLRMEGDGRSTTMYMLHNCYQMALGEARAPSFWKQAFALEASALFMLFAHVSGQDSL